jgi:hypothetical protein
MHVKWMQKSAPVETGGAFLIRVKRSDVAFGLHLLDFGNGARAKGPWGTHWRSS